VLQLNESLEIGIKRREREGQRAAPGWKCNKKQSSKNSLKRGKNWKLEVIPILQCPVHKHGKLKESYLTFRS